MNALGVNQSCMNTTKEEKMQECYSKAKEYLVEIILLELKGKELRRYFNIKKTFVPGGEKTT